MAASTRRSFLVQTGALAAASMLPRPVSSQGAKRKVALVGTGVRGLGTWGLGTLRDYADLIQFVGLSDHNPGRLEYARQRMDVDCPTFVDFDQMLREAKPDVVVVTTVDATHHQFIIKALDAGCDVITEKPLTTDETRLQGILDAVERNGRDIIVTHNYRYSPHRLKMKELLAAGRIGELTSVDFHWYLDIYHGAAYFRRWHGKEKNSGTLYVHKCCHHFDLLNWWVGSEPEIVYGSAGRDFYGEKGPFHHTHCRTCPHQKKCDFYWDITKDDRLMRLYVDHEQHDGYLRDGCVFSLENDIFDKMAAQITYANGVQVSYSCTTYSPYEGYRIAFNGTRGRMEAWIKERQPWQVADQDEIRITDNFGQTEELIIPHATGGHGGGDTRMTDKIWKNPDAADPYGQASGVREGAMAALIGIAARTSARSGQPVRIADLSSLKPRA
jgi:predicted dehydrogenase